jgi:hypothetical protein
MIPMHSTPIRWRAALFAALAGSQALAAPIPHSLTHTFQSPSTSPQIDTRLGFVVARDGNLMALASPFDNLGGEDSGSVWLHDASSGALLHRLDNPRPAPLAYFGLAIAVSGTRVIVGAPDDNLGASDAGIAHVYDLASATPGTPVLTIPNPFPGNDDHFGQAVAMSGTRVVIGAPNADSGLANAGRVYVFDLAAASPAVPVLHLDNPDAAGTNFGHAVALSGDRVAVGACQIAAGADGSRAHVFDLSAGDPAVPVLSLADPTPATNEQFGFAVGLSGDHLLVSAPLDDAAGLDSGAVFAYDLGAATPGTPVATLRDSTPAAGDQFGISLSISGNLAAIGAHLDDDGASDSGSVYVFDLASAAPEAVIAAIDNPGPQSGDEFGRAVALDGTRLLVGAHSDSSGSNNSGTAYGFELSSGTPATPVLTIQNPSPPSGEEFASAVAISGSRVAAGSSRDDPFASNSGSVAVFDFTSPTPTLPALVLHNPSPAMNDYFGDSLAASGSLLAVSAHQDDTGASNAGSVYVYDLASATPTVPWRVLHNPAPQTQDEFGEALAMSGSRLVVGAPKNDSGAVNAGTVYVFDLASATPAVPVAVIDNPSPAIDDEFGNAVAISGDLVAIGAHRDDAGAANSGRVQVYNLSTSIPSVPVWTIDHPSPAADDRFGHSLALAGSYLVVGSHLDDSAGTDSGSVWVYDLAAPNPTVPWETLTRPDPETEDHFGSSVAISGSRIVVGAPGTDLAADESGAAYVYELHSATRTVPAAILDTGALREADGFGSAVAIDGPNLVVGAPFQDGNTHDRGAAHLFDPDPPAPGLQVEQPPGNGLIGGAASIHFGNAAIGSSGTTQTVVIRNVGTAVLEIEGISISGGDAGDFSFAAPALPASLAVDALMEIDVSFIPDLAGGRVAMLRIASNADGGLPFEITLTGQALSAADDTDGDGLNDVAELGLEALGFDWQVNDEELLAILQAGANAEGLFSAAQLQAMAPGSGPLLPRDPASGCFKLTLAFQTSPDLSGFSLFPMRSPQVTINGQGALEFRFEPIDAPAFFRLEAR